jgi:putative phosphoesterase
MSTRVGLISDTHGLLRPEALQALAGSALIVHAGDIGGPELLRQLQAVAPVVAVRGNNDTAPWAQGLPLARTWQVEGVTLHLLHDLKRLDRALLAAEGVQVVIAGHSHKPNIEPRGGVLCVNPGSAGPRRFSLPVSVGELLIEGGQASARIVALEVPQAVSARAGSSLRRSR